jgi:hypothetical protein
MDSNEEFSITLDDLESDSDSGADTGLPSSSETENKESTVPNKGWGTLFELQVLHEKITA